MHLLPAFICEDLDEYGCRVFAAPDGAGYVTVDYKARGFRIGIVRHGKLDSRLDYSGRGWANRLETDAQKTLAELLR